jgi:hypothetical protein
MPNSGIIDAVNQYQLKEKTNLLVMVQNKHTFFRASLHRTGHEKIGFHITLPFMVIPQL